MEYRMVALLNEGERAMWQWRRGDEVSVVDQAFHFTADTVEDALERFWTVGNKMGADDRGMEWPRGRRSMCTGDIVMAVEDGDTTGKSVALWACDMIGWKPLEKYLADNARREAEIEAKLAAERDAGKAVTA